MSSAGILLKHISNPLDPPLIVLFCLADPVIIFFCQLKSKFSATRLHGIPEVSAIAVM